MGEEQRSIQSSGKFLITAEYLVLKGAKALALPLQYGQTLAIQPAASNTIDWKSNVWEDTWFEAQFNITDLHIISATDHEVATALQNVFQQARLLNPHFLSTGVQATITADFNLAWGLGSSSTLIYNIATWAQVDAYILLEKTFGGSGYDIACAPATGPITYQLEEGTRTVLPANFHPVFSAHIFFVYLGKKMNSRTGMSYFREKAVYSGKEIENINAITDALIRCDHLDEFEKLLNRHEEILSSILQMPTIKASQFSDYPYTIKSMGAWGGDFVLVTGEDLAQVKKYFGEKGLETVVPYRDIVLA